MKVLCFGSINFDYIYHVDHFASQGETIPCTDLDIAAGGKGLNQSVALSNAGADTYFAGAVGHNNQLLIDTLKKYNINFDYLKISDIETGHAVIQNDKHGDNCILVYKGSNSDIDNEMALKTISNFSSGDYLVIQNEINDSQNIIKYAKEAGMKVVFNPSPFAENIKLIPASNIDYLVLNEVEACQFLDIDPTESKNIIHDSDFQDKCLTNLLSMYPKTNIILTLGDKGSIFVNSDTKIYQEAYSADVIDTTGAGDTYLGYFIAGIISGMDINTSMNRASRAAALSVSKLGAAQSIPILN